MLSIRGLNVNNSRGLPAVKNLDLDIRRGEIVCIAGIDGNGQNELVDAITGITKIESGEVKLNAKDITHCLIHYEN